MARSSTILVRRRSAKPARALPARIEPMLAVASELPADTRGYSIEWKWDGVRALCFWDGKQMRLDSRNLLNITLRYPELHDMGKSLGRRNAILDGEIIALDVAGQPSFKALQRRMHIASPTDAARLAGLVPVWYVLFDLLHLDGKSLLDEPYHKRREKLLDLIAPGPNWRVTSAHVGEGASMLRAATEANLEGIVAKQVNSPYLPGKRSTAWLKVKVVQRQEFVVGGWIPEASGVQDRVGSLQIGYYDTEQRLRYAGGVGTGLNASDHAMLARLFAKHTRADSPFFDRLPRKGIRFLDPFLVAEIEYRRWPEEGLVQQASYKGVRRDKPPKRVVRERPIQSDNAISTPG